jgi:subtilase family serine protease
MRRRFAPIFATVLVTASAMATSATATPRGSQRVCGAPKPGYVSCLAHVRTLGTDTLITRTPQGLSPAHMKAAYGWSTDPTAGTGQTIAIVDAFDDRYAEANLAIFSQQFGLPSCTTLNGCFTKVGQTGGPTNHLHKNKGWAIEVALDVEWAHAIAPGAHILLVEATTNKGVDLYAAEDYAKAHAQYVSNSWGGGEYAGEQQDDAHFTQPNVSIFASAGDEYAIPEYPSTSRSVISVGGTTLHFNTDGSFASETGWDEGGGGCSDFELGTTAQEKFIQSANVCFFGEIRATPDFSLDADPNSGASVYYHSGTRASRGWYVIGGTSLSSPMAAARAATTGIVVNGDAVYGNTMTFRDITQGYNGEFCKVGYDLCTGRGSWIGATP